MSISGYGSWQSLKCGIINRWARISTLDSLGNKVIRYNPGLRVSKPSGLRLGTEHASVWGSGEVLVAGNGLDELTSVIDGTNTALKTMTTSFLRNTVKIQSYTAT